MEITYTLDQIKEVATEILNCNPERVILFNGQMGAGKTTLIKALGVELGVEDAMSSPTFSIVNEYKYDNDCSLFHFDLYRLRNTSEAYDLGIDEYLYSGHYCFIEWPEKIEKILPDNFSVINIEVLDDGLRRLTLN